METTGAGSLQRTSRRAVWAAIAIAAITVLVLWAMGRTWWCACGSWNPVSLDTWSRHNSQHLLDPYSPSHFQHGLVFFAILWPLFRGARPDLRFAMAIAIEAGWEVLENTPLVIERYRETTVSLDYSGDTVLNSLGDLFACAAGYHVASRLPWWGIVGIYTAIEIAMILWIRDSLILNVLMLVSPIEAVRNWQIGG